MAAATVMTIPRRTMRVTLTGLMPISFRLLAIAGTPRGRFKTGATRTRDPRRIYVVFEKQARQPAVISHRRSQIGDASE
jgi:hypothetical protein